MNFRNVINRIPSPVIVFLPIYEDNTIVDFSIEFENEAFIKCAGHVVSDSKKWSDFKGKVTSSIPWFDMAINAINKKPYPDETYFSPATKNFYKIEMDVTEGQHLVITFIDITTEKRYFQKLKEATTKDTLTGLTKRTGFSDCFDVVLDTARYEGTKVGILTIDVDDLRFINDSLGTDAGDKILIKAADILKKFERDEIKVFRYGGDEFVILISNITSIDTILNITDTIFEAFQNNEIRISGGVAVFPDHSNQKDELMRFSDMATHCAKREGKNQIKFFDIDMERIFVKQLTMQAKLTDAVQNSNFRLFFQPQFDIKTGDLRGFEALIRWSDPELGDISPAVFIPLAEQNGLILPIGSWVLKTAVTTLKKWQCDYNFRGIISVNISPIQLMHPSFLFEIKELLQKTQVDAQYLEVEITEGVMIHNVNETIDTLKELKSLGIKVSLDDFGTGYSSLSYLQKLPLNTLKIDKSFINDITSKDGVQANITSSIINMVTNMGLETIAEGVENPNQLSVLQGFNCDIVQGFLSGKPMPSEKCEAYLAGDKSALLTNTSDNI